LRHDLGGFCFVGPFGFYNEREHSQPTIINHQLIDEYREENEGLTIFFLIDTFEDDGDMGAGDGDGAVADAVIVDLTGDAEACR